MEKGFTKKKAIMILIPVLILVVVPVSVAAWYILSRNAGVNMFGGKMSKWDLIVSDTPGGDPIEEGEFLKINVDEFTNVTSGVMAPGTYGTIDLYIRTTSDVVSEYAIYVDKTKLRLDAYDSTATGSEIQEQKDANSKMLQKHIKFYTDSTFTKEVDMDTPLVGSIELGKEAKATIYWYWVYDGSDDVPSNITNDADIQDFLYQWDLDDCFISDNQDKLSGNLEVYVSAYQQEPNKR